MRKKESQREKSANLLLNVRDTGSDLILYLYYTPHYIPLSSFAVPAVKDSISPQITFHRFLFHPRQLPYSYDADADLISLPSTPTT